MNSPTNQSGKDARRFACTSCGKCCDSGPEMELGEATALADRFITSVIFKLHSLPLDERSEHAATWWKGEGSRIPLRAALEEKRRHLGHFASWKSIDRTRDRSIHLTISAMVNDDGKGRCPALAEGLCSIYEERPLTCRTVPLHYSRPLSVLNSYLDSFTGNPGYRCDITSDAPVIIRGRTIVDPSILQARDDAVRLAKTERVWKDHMLALMADADAAATAELPTRDAIARNSDNGYATTLPMLVAWRVASSLGLMSLEAFENVCRKQASLIRNEIAAASEAHRMQELLGILSAYEFELAKPRKPASGGLSLLMPNPEP